MEDQKLHYKFFRTSSVFVVSVCVLCFFVWCSSGLELSMKSFNALFFSIISRTLHRKYMFLLCNAILAFLVKTSFSSSPHSDFSLDHLQPSHFQDAEAQISAEECASLLVEEQEQEVERLIKPEDCEEMQEDDTSSKEMKEGKEGGGKKEAFIEEEEEAFPVDEEDEEEEDEETGPILIATREEMVNTEELNRKFEEFIRKMKQEIRIEARRQLIAI